MLGSSPLGGQPLGGGGSSYTIWTTLQGSMTLSNSNLTVTSSSGTGSVKSVDFRSTGKFYFEATMAVIANTSTAPGIGSNSSVLNDYIFVVNKTGTIYVNNRSTGLTLGTLSANDVLCFAVDLDAKHIWVRKGASGNWNGSASADPASDTGFVLYNYASHVTPFAQIGATSDSITLNSGDSAFTGTAPSGFTSGWATPGEVTTGAVTLTAAEVFYAGTPNAAVTLTAIEVWAETRTAPVGGALLLVGY